MGNTPALTDQEVNSEAELLKSRDLLEQVVLTNGIQNAQGRGFLNFLYSKQTEADRVARAVRTLPIRFRWIDSSSVTALLKKGIATETRGWGFVFGIPFVRQLVKNCSLTLLGEP
jgi:hypothetical protein